MADGSGIFICPSCQAMVKGAMDGEQGRVCQDCGYEFEREPGWGGTRKATSVPVGRSSRGSSSVIRNLTAKKSLPVRPVAKVIGPPVAARSSEQAVTEAGLGSDDEETVMPDGTRKVRRRKKRKKDEKNKGLVLFLLAWFCVIVLILVFFKVGKGKSVQEEEGAEERLEAADRAARDLAVMRQLLPEISEKFRGNRGASNDPLGFLFQPTLDARKQYIDQLNDLSLAFSRHYENTVFPVPKSSDVRRIDENVLSFLDDDIAIETIWEDATGQRWGAVHVFDPVESWKLDWEAFAPSSTESWAKFRANLGAQEGVFRLLVRKRVSVNEEDAFNVSFYRAPYVFETENEYKNTQSPEVELKTDSELGRQFLKLWNDYQEGRAPYGSILAKNLDPRGHMRITVRLAWEDDGGSEEKMVLREILGVGWFGKRIQEFHAEEMRRATDKATETLTELSGEDS